VRAPPLDQVLAGHECVTPQDRGWGGITNGELLRRAKQEFDFFITSDQNIRYQPSAEFVIVDLLALIL
jgi:hypothetical protein